MEKDFKGKKIAVLGLGIEGKDALRFFLENNARVTIFDQKEKDELDLSGLPVDQIEFVCGDNYLNGDFEKFDLIVRSPGIYRYLPQLVNADKNGIVITSNIKLFFDLCPCKIVGITGTKGKGTTSTLIYEILKASGYDVYLIGNIGIPALGLLTKLKKDSIAVVELSSFQLIDLEKSPNVSVVLNITIDHMDWHKNRDEYVQAKMNIVKYQKEDDVSVINIDYETSKNFSKYTKGKVYFFSSHQHTNGCYVKDGEVIMNIDGEALLGKTNTLQLRGKHNWENINAAICGSYLAGAKLESIKKIVWKFKGLEHRLELVGKYNGISFYNDSFSTNPQTTIAAVKSFSEPIVVILGGSDKGLEYKEMSKEIVATGNVKAVILIGQIAGKIENELKNVKYEGKIENLGMTTIKQIVDYSIQLSNEGDVVILSPATASFGMFKDYKDRGNQFKYEIKRLLSD